MQFGQVRRKVEPVEPGIGDIVALKVCWLECVQALETIEQRSQLLRRGRGAERFTRQPAVDDSREGDDSATVVQPKRLRRDVQPGSVYQP